MPDLSRRPDWLDRWGRPVDEDEPTTQIAKDGYAVRVPVLMMDHTKRPPELAVRQASRAAQFADARAIAYDEMKSRMSNAWSGNTRSPAVRHDTPEKAYGAMVRHLGDQWRGGAQTTTADHDAPEPTRPAAVRDAGGEPTAASALLPATATTPRQQLESEALRLLGGGDVKALSDADIRRSVVKYYLGDAAVSNRPDAFVTGAYKGIVESSPVKHELMLAGRRLAENALRPSASEARH